MSWDIYTMNFVDLPREYFKGQTLIGQNLWNPGDVGSGCSKLDIKFPRLVKIAGISFKNHFTAELQIWLKHAQKVKTNQRNKAPMELVWIAAVPKMILMPHPHFEEGGSENFTILLPSSYFVESMKIVLKQPSFQWNRFFIYQISMVERLPLNIQAREQFMDSKNKKHLDQVKFLEQQTKKSLNIPKQENDSGIFYRANNDVFYELSLLPYTD